LKRLGFYQDMAVNVIGFIPLGFFFALWLLRFTRLSSPAAFTLTFLLGTLIGIGLLHMVQKRKTFGFLDLQGLLGLSGLFGSFSHLSLLGPLGCRSINSTSSNWILNSMTSTFG
jgi:hypothetical protein